MIIVNVESLKIELNLMDSVKFPMDEMGDVSELYESLLSKLGNDKEFCIEFTEGITSLTNPEYH